MGMGQRQRERGGEQGAERERERRMEIKKNNHFLGLPKSEKYIKTGDRQQT